jgi:hypothetical protein
MGQDHLRLSSERKLTGQRVATDRKYNDRAV